MDRNPLKGLVPPREESPQRPMMEPARYRKMLAVAQEVDWRFYTALVLAHETGHRIGAIRALRWSDIDLAGQCVHWRKTNDKIGLEHVTPLTDAAIAALGEARRTSPGVGEAWVFPAPRDESREVARDLMTGWWKRAEEEAGLERIRWLGWHSLRRRFGTDLKDVPLRELCDLGGWKDPDTVVRCYQRSDQQDLREALARRRGTG